MFARLPLFSQCRRRLTRDCGCAAFSFFSSACYSTAARADCPPNASIADWVFGGKLCQAATTFGAETAGASPTLIVVVHGDISDGGRATYHAAFAKTLARPGTVVVALTRPGYTDERGRTSEGNTYRRRDNYTRDNIAARRRRDRGAAQRTTSRAVSSMWATPAARRSAAC